MQQSGRWERGPLAPVLVFFTSASVLVLEILAGRLVAPYVGVSLETYTGIIGTVLAGIALGSAIGGRLADRHDPRPLLGPLLLASAATSIASIPIIAALGPTIARTGDGPQGVVVLALTAFVVPTALLSAVSPMAAKLRLATTAETGTVVGGLSAAGTAGALAGTFVTGFVLVAALPTRPIILGVGGALAITGAAFTISAWRRPSPPQSVALVVLVVALVSAPLAVAATASPCQRETAYYCVDVVADPARPSGRTLVLDNLNHSYVDLDDPTFLQFRYTQLFGLVVDAALDGPVDAIHIGGGGFTFPRWLAATRPGSTSTVLELDEEVLEIARAQLGLVTGPDLEVRTGDARLGIVDQPTDAFDLAVGDAFGGLSVPWHLTTVEMVREVERVLRDGGLYVLNVIDGGPRDLVRAELATLASVFDEVAVIVPPGRPDGNHVLVASDRIFPMPSLDPDDGEVLRGTELERFVGDARPLRDDFAPADQLLTR